MYFKFRQAKAAGLSILAAVIIANCCFAGTNSAQIGRAKMVKKVKADKSISMTPKCVIVTTVSADDGPVHTAVLIAVVEGFANRHNASSEAALYTLD